MDYSSKEAIDNLKHPLISLNSGKQKDFIKALYYKIALKEAKRIIYYLKEEVRRLKKRETNQSKEINRLKKVNIEQSKKLKILRKCKK